MEKNTHTMKKTDLDLVEHIDHRTEVRLKAMRHITDMTMFNLEQHDDGIIHEMRRSLFAIMDAMQDEIDARQEQRFHENWLEDDEPVQWVSDIEYKSEEQ